MSQPLDGGFPVATGVGRVEPGDDPVTWLAPIVSASGPAGDPHDEQNRAASGRTAWQLAHSIPGIMTCVSHEASRDGDRQAVTRSRLERSARHWFFCVGPDPGECRDRE